MRLDLIKRVLTQQYGLPLRAVEPIPGGWAADAYRAETATTAYFVKVYDKRRASVRPWIARMEGYMPVVLWLYENTAMRDWMVAPLLTAGGEYKANDGCHTILVFPMIRGTTIGDARLQPEQVRQLAAALAALHACGEQIPVPTGAIQEVFDLPFAGELKALVDAVGKRADLEKALHPYRDSLREGIRRLRRLSVRLRENRACRVLCHTDIHGGNLMWNGRIVLIDWEGLLLAPAEADLFVFTQGFFFDDAGDSFMRAYRTLRGEYVLNVDAMRFYRLRRRVQDIWEFAHSISCDNLGAPERTAALAHLQRECRALTEML